MLIDESFGDIPIISRPTDPVGCVGHDFRAAVREAVNYVERKFGVPVRTIAKLDQQAPDLLKLTLQKARDKCLPIRFDRDPDIPSSSAKPLSN
ncbi:hypothetical protein [Cereibacter sediminicola]|uniref:hypothetical protein n=1 Tax=Cereibacter sediminicola TaxID=2584941 RepID=UPI0011A19D91|nr:hypothetical protein [Cereibacter sediminicola]